jgi:hypothetical protein
MSEGCGERRAEGKESGMWGQGAGGAGCDKEEEDLRTENLESYTSFNIRYNYCGERTIFFDESINYLFEVR